MTLWVASQASFSARISFRACHQSSLPNFLIFSSIIRTKFQKVSLYFVNRISISQIHNQHSNLFFNTNSLLDPTCKLGDCTAFIMYQTIFFIVVGTMVMLWVMHKIYSMASNARRYRESTEIRKERISSQPRGEREFSGYMC